MSKSTIMVAGVAAALIWSAGTQAQGPGGGQGQGAQGQQGSQGAGQSGGDRDTKSPQRQEKSGDKGGGAPRAQKSDDGRAPPRQQKADDQGKAPPRQQKADDQGKSSRQQKADDQGKSPARQQKADDQGKASRQQKADDQGKSPTRQQKAEDRNRDRQQKADDAKRGNAKQPKSADDANRQKSDKSGTAQQKGTDQDRVNRNAAGSGNQANPRRAEISTEQRTNLRQNIVRAPSVNRVTNIRVNVNVGTRVPRSVRLATLPASAISIVPAYRSYRYFVVEERIVIVDPATYVIVEVIDNAGPGDRDGGGARLILTDAEREILLREIELDSASTLGIGSLVIGADVPRAARVRSLPDRVVSDVPKVRNYRYFTAENRIVLVAPNDDRVVFVIEGRR